MGNSRTNENLQTQNLGTLVKFSKPILSAGIHKLSEQDYFGLDDHISKSGLDRVAKSPRCFKHFRDHPVERDTDAMRLGKAVHMALLEPDRFESVYTRQPKFDRRTTAGKKDYQAWQEANSSKIGLDEPTLELVIGMREAVMNNFIARQILSDGEAERSILWQSEYPHVKCKARADWLTPDWLVDLKTTKDASLDGFMKSFTFFRYHVQLAYYLDGLKAVGKPRQHAMLIVVESEPPHHVAIYAPDSETIEAGRVLYKRDLDVYAQCLEQDYWPGLPEQVQTISLPKWMKGAA